jgi:hypothetical protein
MRWYQSKPAGSLVGVEATIVCNAEIWRVGVLELERRTLGARRESGAFLLGDDKCGCKRILEFVYYDDIDPHSLDSGIVHFAGSRLPRLWDCCRRRGYGVVADVHVHPLGYGQSGSDQAHPVIPRTGHIAIIIPHYASRGTKPGEIGIYQYLGNGAWVDYTIEGSRFFQLTHGR